LDRRSLAELWSKGGVSVSPGQVAARIVASKRSAASACGVRLGQPAGVAARLGELEELVGEGPRGVELAAST